MKLLYVLQANGTLLDCTWTLMTVSCKQSEHPVGVMKITATRCLGAGLLESVAVGLSPRPGLVCSMQCRMSVAVKFVKRLQNSSSTRVNRK